jgi:hypothetical protein
MIKLVIKQVVLFFLIVSPFIGYSQEEDNPGWDEGDVDGQTISDTPIDGGLCLLLATGVLVGIKQLRKQKTDGETYNEVE